MRLFRNVLRALLLAPCFALPAACARDLTGTRPDETPLRTYARQHGRYVGASLGIALRTPGEAGVRLREIMAREFNMVWTGRFMKFDYLRPTRSEPYRFGAADSILDFAHRNDMVMRGTVLVWDQQIPTWLDEAWPADTVRSVLKDYIEQVVGHYRGRLFSWDVAAEVIDPYGSYRDSYWLRHLGPQYIEDAFRWAHAADPDVPLYYLDYYIELTGIKQNRVYEMLRDFKARGVPVDGVAFEYHQPITWMLTYEQILAVFQKFAALGLKIQITEGDLHIPVLNGLGDSTYLAYQERAYRNLVAACLATPACNTFEVEALYDGDAWIYEPTLAAPAGTTWGAPVLFDVNLQPKPAYFGVKAELAKP